MTEAQPVSGNGRPPAPKNGQPALPVARSHRWQPIRSGLLNIYRFDQQEFWFEDGRLLLRGNNGTGKSRILALQLPFLLDGDTSPHRLEPDGDIAKSLEWNLLVGKYKDRLGYTWIEFGRADADGTPHYVTLGCGLWAAEGRGITQKWFFVTGQRIGPELVLAPQQIPLTRDRLAEAIGNHGRVYTTASEYRKAIDRKLFKLGEHRYAALIKLLIQLRQPQLSRQLDDKKLSAALSEALPPPPDDMIADIAESFRNLEDDRIALEGLKAATVAVTAFLKHYGIYLEAAAARKAGRARQEQGAYESTRARLRMAREDRARAGKALEVIDRRIGQLQVRENEARARVQALVESPQMRDAQALDQARRDAEDREKEAARAGRDLTEIKARRIKLETELEAAVKRAEAGQRRVAEAEKKARAHAAGIDPGAVHNAAMEQAVLPAGPEASQFDLARQRLERELNLKRQALELVRELERALETAESELTDSKKSQAYIENQLETAVEAHRLAYQAMRSAAGKLLASYDMWRNTLRELSAPDTDSIRDAFLDWSEHADGENPMMETVKEAERTAINVLATERARLDHKLHLEQQRMWSPSSWDSMRETLSNRRQRLGETSKGGRNEPARRSGGCAISPMTFRIPTAPAWRPRWNPRASSTPG